MYVPPEVARPFLAQGALSQLAVRCLPLTASVQGRLLETGETQGLSQAVGLAPVYWDQTFSSCPLFGQLCEGTQGQCA